MLPPGPQRLSLLQVAQWLRRPFPFLEECVERYGETFTVQIAAGMPSMVILSNPEHIREVFAADGDAMHAGEMAVTLKPFLGERSLILLDGAEHMRMRKLMLPPFHGERMHAYGRQMVECTHASIDAWPRGEEFPIHRPMQRITLDVILRTVFGIDEEGPRERLGALLEELLDLAAWPGCACTDAFPEGRAMQPVGARVGSCRLGRCLPPPVGRSIDTSCTGVPPAEPRRCPRRTPHRAALGC